MNVKKCVRALLCLYLTLIIAMDAVKAQTLKVGDTFPPELWSMPLQVLNHPNGKETLTLSEYKGKLIILDFWATWCAPCIKSLTKLDSLQKEFGEQLAVIPITYENADKVLAFLTKRGYQLPSVINDSTLKKYFSHRSIPHQVWVRAGEVLAVTGAEYATRENIRKTLNKEKVQMLMKKEDMEFDSDQPLLINNNGGGIEQARLRSVFSKRININTGGVKVGKNTIRIYNAPFTSLLYEMFSTQIPFGTVRSRIVWEVDDLLRDDFLGAGRVKTGINVMDTDYYSWLSEYSYCYELYLDTNLHVSREVFLNFMRDDLNRYFRLEKGIEIMLEDREVLCYTIIETEKPETALISESGNTDDGKFFVLNNKPTHQLENFLVHALARHPYPVVSGVTGETNVSVRLKKNKGDLSSVRESLIKSGLDIVLQKQKVKVIVVRYIDMNTSLLP